MPERNVVLTERVLSQEERIRRAEQIAELRRNERGTYRRESLINNRKDDSEEEIKKNFVVRRMIKQICICLILYTIFFIIKNQNFIFSENFINQTKEILSYDVNFIEIYNNGIIFLQEQYNSEYNNQEQKNEEKIENDTDEKETKDEEKIKENKNEDDKEKTEEKEKNTKEDKTEKLSEAEKDVKLLEEKYSLIKPVTGIVSSDFGDREDENPIVTEEHKGIDIAANKGTEIVAAMDGVVDIATTSSTYGKYIEIKDGEVKTIYAHCDKLYVKEGDKVKKGQKIAEVGSTGAATRTTSSF